MTEFQLRFGGDRSGDWPLTWGQLSVHRWVRWLGRHETSLNIPYVLPVDGEHDLATVLAALRMLVQEHEALRTRYPRTARGLRQRVAASGLLPVTVHDQDQDQDRDPGLDDGPEHGPEPVEAAAQRLADRLAEVPFRHDTELPVRVGVLRTGGRPRAVALAVSHLSADWAALLLLTRRWSELLRSGAGGWSGADGDRLGGGRPGGDGGWQPVDQALAERTGPVAAAGAAALARWQAELRRIPRSMLDFPTREPEPDRYVRLGMDSPATAVAATLLAQRWGASTTTVLTVAATVLVAALTGHDTAAVRQVCGNRRDPPLRDLVGKIAQDGLLVLEPSQPTFPEVVRHGHERLRSTYATSRYDPEALDRIRARTGEARGASLDLLVFFNDFRYDGSWSRLPATRSPADLVPRTRIDLDFTTERAHAKLFFTVEPALDTCQLHLLMDTARVPRETGAALLRGVERLLLASLDGAVPTERVAEVAGITPVRRPAHWVRIGPDWIDPIATGELLRRAAPARHAVIELPDPGRDPLGSSRPGLTAYLVPDEPGVSVREVHARVMAALVGRTDVLAPAWYVLCARPPAEPGDPARWRACPRIEEGDGRDLERAYPPGALPPEGP